MISASDRIAIVPGCLGAAACVASALLLDVPIPETGSAEILKCQC